jgi:hypothetical protein
MFPSKSNPDIPSKREEFSEDSEQLSVCMEMKNLKFNGISNDLTSA